jgi:hypothetical protein
MMKCISWKEGIQLLRDIHSGICESHSSWCSIIGKAFRHGFYWSTAKDDTMEIITKCRDCQFFQKQTTKHANLLQPIDLSWPFAIWGIDIVSVLPRAPGGLRFVFITIDTFTKWIVTLTFYKNRKICANRSAYKNAYQIVVHMKNFPKINLV